MTSHHGNELAVLLQGCDVVNELNDFVAGTVGKLMTGYVVAFLCCSDEGTDRLGCLLHGLAKLRSMSCAPSNTTTTPRRMRNDPNTTYFSNNDKEDVHQTWLLDGHGRMTDTLSMPCAAAKAAQARMSVTHT